MNKTVLTLLAGVVLGLLLAPDKGSETLRKIRNRVKDLKDQATDHANDLVEKGKEVYREGESRFIDELG